MNRRLAAVLLADVVGYRRLMEADEAGTLIALKQRRRKVLEPVLRERGGRIVKFMGDGVLIEFASAVAAVGVALALQREMDAANAAEPAGRAIRLRIGVTLGDVIGEGSDLYGEGVNIAARLESLAEPGGIYISANLFEEVRGKVAASFEDLGEQNVKNLSRAIRAYRVRAASEGDQSPARIAPSLPDKPSIAVLPFSNISGDPDQEYYAGAYAMGARCYLQRKGFGWVADRTADVMETRRLARRAVELGRQDAVSLANAGMALVIVVGELDEGAVLLDEALALNQNLAWVWHFSALAKAFLGEPQLAIEQAERAMRLSPQDPQTFAMETAIAWGHFFQGRDQEASSWAEAALRRQPGFLVGACIAAAAAANAGHTDAAARAIKRVRSLDPSLRIGNLRTFLPFRRSQDYARWEEGLRRAGLPE